MADVTSLKSTGDSSKRVDLVLVAEGYTDAERAKFITDSTNFTNFVFSQNNKTLNDPFYSYSALFNVWAVYTPSQQSGYSTDTIKVNTAFDAKAYLADGRLVYGDSNKVINVVNTVLRPTQQEMIIVLVNSDKYGGAGGTVAWATAGNPASYNVAMHEIGHSFAGLQDEYVDAAIADRYPLSALATSVHVSATNDLSQVNWKDWVGFSDSLGTVGAYEGGYYRTTGVWRATQNSKMLNSDAPFSAPEKEQFINRFYDAVKGYTTLAQTSVINVKATTPQDSLFSLTWSAGNQTVTGKGMTADLETYIRGLADGPQTIALTATTADKTGFIRKAAVLANSTDQSTINLQVTKTTFGDAADTFTAPTAGNAFILAGGGDDVITVQTSSNFIDGGAGNDRITGGSGNDIVRGGGGNDTINGGAGRDTVIVAGPRADYTITMAGGTTSLTDRIATREGTDTLTNVERVIFSDAVVALDTDGNAGQGYRIYQAAFARTPDLPGLSYWVNQLDTKISLRDLAFGFIASNEFKTVYGAAPTNLQLVTKFYQNVLGRDGEKAGIDYWVGLLDKGTSVIDVLAGFSEGKENIDKVAPLIGQGITLEASAFV